MNKVIALDIGRVCVELRFDRCKEALGFTEGEEPPEYFMQASQKFEHGGCSVTEWLSVFQRLTNKRFTDLELLHAWNLIIGDEVAGMAELVEEICGLGYRFVFFSDTNEPHIMHCFRNLSFAHLVTGQILSFEVGVQKPHDDMYKAFEQEYGKPCYYIDDKPENIEGGIRNGWQSQLFTDAQSFRKMFFEKVVQSSQEL